MAIEMLNDFESLWAFNYKVLVVSWTRVLKTSFKVAKLEIRTLKLPLILD